MINGSKTNKGHAFIIYFLCTILLSAQQKNGIIRVRKSISQKGLYVLDEVGYYKMKLYVRLFDNNEAIFLNAPIDSKKANDSTAQLLYTYRIKPAAYKIINDSIYIHGSENKFPVTYLGVIRLGKLEVRKRYKGRIESVVFKKVL